MKKFELDEKQEALLKVWQDLIKEEYGEYGVYDYTFTPFGLGIIVKVRSHLTGSELLLSNTENW